MGPEEAPRPSFGLALGACGRFGTNRPGSKQHGPEGVTLVGRKP